MESFGHDWGSILADANGFIVAVHRLGLLRHKQTTKHQPLLVLLVWILNPPETNMIKIFHDYQCVEHVITMIFICHIDCR